MLRTDKCALMCDLAEVYHIYDYRSLPATRVATFAAGLRNNSRIKSIMRGDDLKGNDRAELMLANISDILLAYFSGDKNVPSMVSILLDEVKNDAGSDDLQIFDSPEEFDNARNAIIGE